MKLLLIISISVVLIGVLLTVIIRNRAKKAEILPKPQIKITESASILNDAAPIIRSPMPEQQQPIAAKASVTEQAIPEDSVLRRHYLSNRQAEKRMISNPYPTDSTLRRHYESYLASLLDKKTSGTESLSNQAQTVTVGVSQRAVEAEVKSAGLKSESKEGRKINLPEDSTLRRHFLTQIQAEIESKLMPKPSDSTLRRHYETLFNNKLDEYIGNSVC